MTMEDVWLETFHPIDGRDKQVSNSSVEDVMVETVRKTERRDRKTNDRVAVKKEGASAQDRGKRVAARKDDRGQQRKRAA